MSGTAHLKFDKRRVLVSGRLIQEDRKKVPQSRVDTAIQKLSKGCPAEPLHGEELRGLFRITMGDYRAIVQVVQTINEDVALILEVFHRSTDYEDPEAPDRKV